MIHELFSSIIAMYSSPFYNWKTTLINLIVGIFFFFTLRCLFSKKILCERDIESYALPWILLGLMIRISHDLYVLPSPYYLFVITPFIYLEIFVVSVSLFLITRRWKKEHRKIVLFYIPLCLSLLFLSSYIFSRFVVFLTRSVFLIPFFLLIPLFFLLRLLFSRSLSLMILSQIYDGMTTFISITFLGFKEEHILGRYLINFFEMHGLVLFNSGSIFFLLSKSLLILLTAFLFKKYEIEKEREGRLVILLITYLGFITGSRNLLNILLW